MNNQSLKRAFLALSIVFVLVFSCFSVNVFADTTTDGTVTTSPEETTAAGTTAAETTTSADTTTASTTTSSSNTSTAKKSYLDLIVTLIVVAVIVIAGLIYYLKNKEKVHKFMRGFKGEFSKVSWVSKTEVRKNTIIVVVIVIISVVAIALLDFVFSKLVWFLMNLFM